MFCWIDFCWLIVLVFFFILGLEFSLSQKHTATSLKWQGSVLFEVLPSWYLTIRFQDCEFELDWSESTEIRRNLLKQDWISGKPDWIFLGIGLESKTFCWVPHSQLGTVSKNDDRFAIVGKCVGREMEGNEVLGSHLIMRNNKCYQTKQ